MDEVETSVPTTVFMDILSHGAEILSVPSLGSPFTRINLLFFCFSNFFVLEAEYFDNHRPLVLDPRYLASVHHKKMQGTDFISRMIAGCGCKRRCFHSCRVSDLEAALHDWDRPLSERRIELLRYLKSRLCNNPQHSPEEVHVIAGHSFRLQWMMSNGESHFICPQALCLLTGVSRHMLKNAATVAGLEAHGIQPEFVSTRSPWNP